jgi:molybdopterin-binding protein
LKSTASDFVATSIVEAARELRLRDGRPVAAIIKACYVILATTE